VKMLTNARGYDWSTWLMGIMRSFVNGGAGAVSGMLGPMVSDPQHFNLGDGWRHTLTSMGVSFVIVGLVSMCLFLQTHAVPEEANG
jgi:hypothetical protein